MAFPLTDGPLVPYGLNWKERLSASVTTYGLVQAQANEFIDAYDRYVEKVNELQAARQAGIRSVQLTADRNDARRELVKLGRELYAFMQANNSVSDGAKLSMGVVVPDREPTPAPFPAEKPVLSIGSVVDRTVRLVIRREDGESGRPAGVFGAVVFFAVGVESAPAAMGAWKMMGTVGRSVVTIPFPAEVEPGTPVWFTAMWINNRKESGPLASPICAFLGGGVAKAG
jgi:hypothetical protein